LLYETFLCLVINQRPNCNSRKAKIIYIIDKVVEGTNLKGIKFAKVVSEAAAAKSFLSRIFISTTSWSFNCINCAAAASAAAAVTMYSYFRSCSPFCRVLKISC